MPPALKSHFDQVVSLRNRLKDCNPRPQEDMDLLASLVRAVKPSQAYERSFKAIQDEFYSWLEKDAGFLSMQSIWPTLNLYEQRVYLQKCVDKQAEFQSRHAIPTTGTIIKWVSPADENEALYNCFGTVGPDFDLPTMEGDNIYINALMPPLRKSLVSALHCVTHEQHHQLNNNLVRAIRFGMISEDHPLYEDAVYFDGLWQEKSFVTFGDAYFEQLDERFAIEFGNGVRKTLENGSTRPAKPAIANPPVLQAA